MDAQSGRPAKNFYVRTITLVILLLIIIIVPLGLGAWYAPFHSVQQMIPENLQLKRENEEMARKLADMATLNTVKDEQLESMRELLHVQETKVVELNNQLRMFTSILDERKGTGIQVLHTSAHWTPTKQIDWQALFVKGGSYPRILQGSYKLFALDEADNKLDINAEKMLYKFESHGFMQRKFDWQEAWLPTELELIIYDYRGKEVMKKIINIQGIE